MGWGAAGAAVSACWLKRGEMNAATSQDFTYYHVVLPARHVETALDVVGDAVMHAVFAPVEVER